MTPPQFIGWTLSNTSAVTAIVGASTLSRITHGLRPQSSSLSSLPSINYYEVGPGTRRNGLGTETFSINNRATTPAAARSLARLVMNALCGSAGTGLYGTNNNFTVMESSLRNDNGLIPETTEGVFNAPVDITIVYPLDTVS